MIRLGPLAGLALVLLSTARPAEAKRKPLTAQEAIEAAYEGHVHDGFYLRGGVGGGAMWWSGSVSSVPNTLGLSSSPSYSGSGYGGAFDLAMGGQIARGVFLGGELAYQQALSANLTGDESGTAFNRVDFGVLGLMADWFPDPETGLHLGGMLGAAQQSTNDYNFSNAAATHGWALGVQGGYDFWVAKDWSLGAQMRATFASTKAVNLNVTEKDTTKAVGFMFSALYN